MDLAKALEADVFGAAEWAIEFYEPLERLADGHERALVAWRLAVNRARFAQEKVERPPPVPAAPEDALSAERAALLDASRATLRDAAGAFVAAYEDRGGTTFDEVLAAIALHNVRKEDEGRAAELFEVAAEEMERRVAGGAIGWRESAKSCWYRAMIAHRAQGNEEAAFGAKKGADRMGGPGVAPGAFGTSRVGQDLGIRPDPGTLRERPPPREEDRER